MNSTPAPQQTSLRLIQRFTLPTIFDRPPGPIHTVVCDATGFIYYSDEMNHAVVALTASGSVRWLKAGHGCAPGEFYYPRGIALGWIVWGIESVRCLAVCDSWNHRIQFFNLIGEFLGVWACAGKEEFEEPTDVRFIANLADSGAGEERGVWYVLDKSRHRLYEIGSNGLLRSQIGQRFPPNLQARWSLPESGREKIISKPECVRPEKPFDFLYYPERILGEDGGNLFVWEPCSQQLKQALGGNLLPVRLNADANLEWIAVDTRTLVGWNRALNQLSIYRKGAVLRQAALQGTPIPTNLHLEELFVQNDGVLERRIWVDTELESTMQEPGMANTHLFCTAQVELSRLDAGRIQESMEKYIDCVDEQLFVLGEILLLRMNNPDPELLRRVLDHLRDITLRLGKSESAVREAIQPWCLAMLEFRLLGVQAAEPANHFSISEIRWMDFKLREKYRQLKKLQEEICEIHRSREIPASHSASYVESWNQLAEMGLCDIPAMLKFLESCSQWEEDKSFERVRRIESK
jgi:hypothetical protein